MPGMPRRRLQEKKTVVVLVAENVEMEGDALKGNNAAGRRWRERFRRSSPRITYDSRAWTGLPSNFISCNHAAGIWRFLIRIATGIFRAFISTRDLSRWNMEAESGSQEQGSSIDDA